MRQEYTNQQVKDKIEYEGLGYCIQYYFSAKNIEDPKLAALWDTAATAMNKIERLLNALEED